MSGDKITESIFLFPNPASNEINIRVLGNGNSNSAIPVEGISIHDFYGRIIQEYDITELNNHTISLEELRAGVYYLKIRSSSHSNSKYYKLNGFYLDFYSVTAYPLVNFNFGRYSAALTYCIFQFQKIDRVTYDTLFKLQKGGHPMLDRKYEFDNPAHIRFKVSYNFGKKEYETKQ